MTGPVIEVADPATGELVSLPGLPAIPGATPVGLDLPENTTRAQWDAVGIKNGWLLPRPSRKARPLKATLNAHDLTRRYGQWRQLQQITESIPAQRCVYIISRGKEVLYVGATRGDARNRLREHKIQRSAVGLILREDAASLRVWIRSYPTWEICRQTEHRFISRLRPPCNVAWRDD